MGKGKKTNSKDIKPAVSEELRALKKSLTMVNIKKRREIYAMWFSLGLGVGEDSGSEVPPERVIVETVRYIVTERDVKVFPLLLLWLGEYENLLRLEPTVKIVFYL